MTPSMKPETTLFSAFCRLPATAHIQPCARKTASRLSLTQVRGAYQLLQALGISALSGGKPPRMHAKECRRPDGIRRFKLFCLAGEPGAYRGLLYSAGPREVYQLDLWPFGKQFRESFGKG
nr:hypothetical protein [Bordetella hinzii]